MMCSEKKDPYENTLVCFELRFRCFFLKATESCVLGQRTPDADFKRQ